MAALRGAAWAVLPSLFAPFESANEFYLLGALPGIARATGGLIQQIVPLRSARSFGHAVESRVSKWHTTSAAPTGILYREPDGLPAVIEDWQFINAAAYDHSNDNNRVNSRLRRKLFRSMVRQLNLALDDGVQIYRQEEDYYRMIPAGIEYLKRTFSWQRNAEELLQLLFE
jgi:glycosyltransferase involved in cell wall biosynthesis